LAEQCQRSNIAGDPTLRLVVDPSPEIDGLLVQKKDTPLWWCGIKMFDSSGIVLCHNSVVYVSASGQRSRRARGSAALRAARFSIDENETGLPLGVAGDAGDGQELPFSVHLAILFKVYRMTLRFHSVISLGPFALASRITRKSSAVGFPEGVDFSIVLGSRIISVGY
jgi:hypothetical protein